VKDLVGVVWTRAGGKSVKMGDLVVTDQESRFTYEDGYAEIGLPGLGTLYSPQLFAGTTIPFMRREGFDLHPPLQGLIPAASDTNFQRQLALRWLEKRDITIPPSGLEQDWLVLTQTGHGGIGHLDMFSSDQDADNWYAPGIEHRLHTIDTKFGFSLKHFLTWYDEVSAEYLGIIGPTPTVGGAIPKLPLSIPAAGWNNTIGLPTKKHTPGVTDVILKMEKNASYPGIVEIEALMLDLHEEAGFDVPRYWVSEIGEIPIIAVERFDRDKNNTPLVNETLLSIMAVASKGITRRDNATYEKVADLIKLANPPVISDKHGAAKHLLKRMVVAMLSGNGDLHLENLSLTGIMGDYRFTPVYDPTPMRAYSIHNMLTPMSFGNYGELDERGNSIHLRRALERFTRYLGLSADTLDQILESLQQVAASLPERIYQLNRLPVEHKDRLIKVIQQTTEEIMPK